MTTARGRRFRAMSYSWLWLVISLSGLSFDVSAQSRSDYLKRFDSDGDGRVSLTEYQEYMSRSFHRMDRNGDGALSALELPAGVRSRTATTLEGHRRALARMFDVLDINNDGYLSATELTAPPR